MTGHGMQGISGVKSRSVGVVQGALVINDATRKIDLTSQLVKIQSELKIENAGSTPETIFSYLILDEEAEKLSFFQPYRMNGKQQSALPYKISKSQTPGAVQYDISVTIPAAGKVELLIEEVFGRRLVPFPKAIKQTEAQFVRFTGSAVLYSPYEVKNQQTTIELSSSTIESYTKVAPVRNVDTKIIYGAYENTAPLEKREIVIHYQNLTPFLSVTKLTRWIEVSHWGNIAVEEIIDVEHTGAKLTGAFSRTEHQRLSNSNAVNKYKTILPAAAMDVYYRDEIGNISTSRLRILDDSVEMEISPRFPLYGGWKTSYKIGYNVPAYEYLRKGNGDSYSLRMRFIDHVFDNMHVDEAQLIIVLPEHSSDIRFMGPSREFGMELLPQTNYKTFLNTVGRPVINVRKYNLVEDHIADFEIVYKYPSWRLLLQPVLLVSAFFLLFFTIIIYVRIDFSITKASGIPLTLGWSEDEASEARMKAAGYSEEAKNCQDKRDRLYKQFDSAVAGFKSSKDNAALQATIRGLNQEYKALTQTISELMGKVKGAGPDVSERLADLQRHDKQIKEIIEQQIRDAEKLVSGKMNKQEYIKTEAVLAKKRSEAEDRLASIVEAL
ncbi:unnamed protein product [Cyprideis torosa]|uniref:Dolichyl-diphosphooligosaccharide--protein glycosyltransferase subunit 1 n=1 Tax=Cyprideis torosa TaxID=163714 RepID=A0A7R8ZHZ6_9CRUS|nr:unnamed protein product [Cyprideis torosa]CAG0884921.1 unnamed protein product [Cyprideis torosa]